LGPIQPIDEISDLLENYPTIQFHVDNVQALGKNIWDKVFTPRVDLSSLSAHKFHAPRGIGILYKKEGKMLSPLNDGGGQEKGPSFRYRKLTSNCRDGKSNSSFT
jgi:cysteine desulfurase